MSEQGTHILGDHIWVVINSGSDAWPSKTTSENAMALIEAIAQCMDLVGAGIPAVRPRAASPAHAHFANRDRSVSSDPERVLGRPLPMNPVQHHYATGTSRRPTSLLDSDYWRDQFYRVDDHWDRCEVVRRAAKHLGSLLRPDPQELEEAAKRKKHARDPSIEQQVLVDGHGHPVDVVARNLRTTVRQVAVTRINAGRHPLTGTQWAAPADNKAAAEEARAMKGQGMTSTDIALALERSANTVRAWTTLTRRAA